MVLSENMAVAVFATLLRQILSKLAFPTAPPSLALEDASVNFLNLQTVITTAGTVFSVFCYLTKNQYWNWRRKLKNLTVIKLHRVEKYREKAKTRLDNNFQSSKKLQRNAMLYMGNQLEDLNFSKKINNAPTTNRLIPTACCSKNIKSDLEVEEPTGTLVSEIVKDLSKIHISHQQEISLEISTDKNQSQLPAILSQPEVNNTLSEYYDVLSKGRVSTKSVFNNNYNLQMGGFIICEKKQQNEENDNIYKRTRSGKIYGLRRNS